MEDLIHITNHKHINDYFSHHYCTGILLYYQIVLNIQNKIVLF